MSYTAWSVVFGEQPTAAKWNQLGQNDAGFKDGTNFDADIIKSKHIDWAATGGGDSGGIWWEELGRTTLGSAAASITLSGLAARKYLRIIVNILQASGDFDPSLRFNNDSASNYWINESNNNGAVSNTTVAQLYMGVAATTRRLFGVIDVINISSEKKLALGKTTSILSSGGVGTVGSSPQSKDVNSLWNNTSAQISRVDFYNISGTSNIPAGSELIVLGHN